MCNKRNSKIVCKDIEEFNFRVDNCMQNLIWVLNNRGVMTCGCCCGHGRYPMTIVYVSPNGKFWDLMSGVEIPRKKRFYIKDKDGFYYIPEVMEEFNRKEGKLKC